jgi:hypothetical protein
MEGLRLEVDPATGQLRKAEALLALANPKLAGVSYSLAP